MDNEVELNALRKRIATAKQDEAKAEVARDNATEARTKALDALSTQFNAASIEEAEILLAALKGKLAVEIKKIDDDLREQGA